MVSTQDQSDGPQILQCFLDTRQLWPVPTQLSKKDEVQHLKIVASRELNLLTSDEQISVLRFYHIRDAKMSLASHLLKHFVISKYCSIPWAESKVSRDLNGKPIYNPPNPQVKRVDFNVSHQAGIVSLIAAVGFSEHIDVGTDVVCWNERKIHDDQHTAKSGFFDWVDMHADVFAESEVSWMKFGTLNLHTNGEPQGYGYDVISRCERRGGELEIEVTCKDGTRKIKIARDKIIDMKLRRFYAMWCLREAYVKMTGEALLAPWLRQLEIVKVQPPSSDNELSDENSLVQGKGVKADKIMFKGKELNDVIMEISALGTDYMIASCVRLPEAWQAQSIKDVISEQWQQLSLDDILPQHNTTNPAISY